MAIQKLLSPPEKYPRDWEGVKDQRNADDVKWCQFSCSAFASNSGHCFVFCKIQIYVGDVFDHD